MQKVGSNIWLWIGLICCFLGSSISLMARHRVETRNKAAMIAIEYDVLKKAIQSQDQPLKLLDYSQKNPGGLGVVLNEHTVKDYVDDQRLSIKIAEQTEISGELRLIELVRTEALNRNFDSELVSERTRGSRIDEKKLVFRDPIDASTLLGISLGADPLQIDELKSSNIPIIMRFANRNGMSIDVLKRQIAQAKLDGIWGYLPVGEQVLGFRANTKDVADALLDKGIYYLSPEFAKIAGEATMLAQHPENDIRLHSIQSGEIDKMSPAAVTERFAKAFSERNMRVLMIRSVDVKGGTTGQQLDDTFQTIKTAVQKEGGKITLPRPFEDPAVQKPIFIIIGLGVGIATTGFLLELLGKQNLPLVAIGGVLCAGLAISETGRSLISLEAGILWPCIAVWYWTKNRNSNYIISFLIMSLMSVIGGLCIAGLMNGLPFLVKADAVNGVKIIQFAPIILLTIWLAHREYGWKNIMANPLTAGSLTTLCIGLVGLGFMLSRTGNDGPAGVSGFELQLRSLLENFLVVRPRTKEFMIGHPAMLIGLFLAGLEGKRKVKLSALTIVLLGTGLIGQTSLVNTMCHLHTPLGISLVRILIGMILGIVFGLAILFFVKPMVRRKKVTE